MELAGSLFLLLAIASSASMTLVLKLFQGGQTNRYAILLGNYLTCIAVGFAVLSDKSAWLRPETQTGICGVIGGILFVAALVLMQGSIGRNGAILTSAFAKLGVVVPLLVSILFFGEKPGAVQALGLILVVISIWVMNGGSLRGSAAGSISPLLLLLVLLTAGAADGMAKVFEHFGNRAQDDVYILYVFATAGLLAFLLLLREYAKTGRPGRPGEYAAGILAGIPNYFSSFFLLKSLAYMPAFAAYTVFSTGSVCLVALACRLFWKERLTRRQAAGFVLILAALALLNIPGN